MSNRPETEDHILFYSENIRAGRIHLDQGETRHLRSVLRVETGDTIYVTDGRGTIYECRVEKLAKRSCDATILHEECRSAVRPSFHFYIGLPDKNPFEEVLASLIPLGVASITPVQCEYCQSPWWAKRWEKRRDRFHRKMIAAAKQSWNPNLPVLEDPIEFNNALKACRGKPLFGQPNGLSVAELARTCGEVAHFSCFVGPPGGFSPAEIEALRGEEALPLALSPYRLRTEHATAAMAAVLVQKFVIGARSTG